MVDRRVAERFGLFEEPLGASHSAFDLANGVEILVEFPPIISAKFLLVVRASGL